MVLCPIALAVGCRKCPVFSVCPVKSVIGDYKPDEPAAPAPAPKEKAASGAKPRATNNRKRARSRRPRK